MTRPTKPAEWADSSTNIVEPTSGRKLQGWDINQVPSSGNQNWWQNQMFQWQSYLDAPFGSISTNPKTLTAADDDVQFISGAARVIILPDETTLAVGRKFRFVVAATQIITIRDSSGTDLVQLAKILPGQRLLFAEFISVSNGAATGNWYWQYDTPGQTFATPTNDDAATGFVGECLTAHRLTASALTLTAATAANICNSPAASLTLTSGDWEISGAAYFTGGGAGDGISAGVSVTSATFPVSSARSVPNSNGEMYLSSVTGISSHTGVVASSIVIPSYRFKLTFGATQTLYFVALSEGTGTTVTGSFQALRVR